VSALPSTYNHGSASRKTSVSVLPDRQNASSSARLASQSFRMSLLMKAVKSVGNVSAATETRQGLLGHSVIKARC